MSSAFEKFEELETRVGRAVELIKTTRQAKEGLELELTGARSQISKMERELEELRKERDQVKNRIESLLENLSELSEEPDVQAEVAPNRR